MEGTHLFLFFVNRTSARGGSDGYSSDGRYIDEGNVDDGEEETHLSPSSGRLVVVWHEVMKSRRRRVEEGGGGNW